MNRREILKSVLLWVTPIVKKLVLLLAIFTIACGEDSPLEPNKVPPTVLVPPVMEEDDEDDSSRRTDFRTPGWYGTITGPGGCLEPTDHQWQFIIEEASANGGHIVWATFHHAEASCEPTTRNASGSFNVSGPTTYRPGESGITTFDWTPKRDCGRFQPDIAIDDGSNGQRVVEVGVVVNTGVNCKPPEKPEEPECTIDCEPEECIVDCEPPVCTIDCEPPPCTHDCEPPVCEDCEPPICEDCEPPVEEHGACTPGYWKQPHHFSSWPINTGTLLTSYFPNAPSITMLEALGYGGPDPVLRFYRHATAAILNSLSFSYPLTVNDITSMTPNNPNKDILDGYNNSIPCPL